MRIVNDVKYLEEIVFINIKISNIPKGEDMSLYFDGNVFHIPFFLNTEPDGIDRIDTY